MSNRPHYRDRLEKLPIHYRDDNPATGELGEMCNWSGAQARTSNGGCPRGCAGAREHYANDGHSECEESC